MGFKLDESGELIKLPTFSSSDSSVFHTTFHTFADKAASDSRR